MSIFKKLFGGRAEEQGPGTVPAPAPEAAPQKPAEKPAGARMIFTQLEKPPLTEAEEQREEEARKRKQFELVQSSLARRAQDEDRIIAQRRRELSTWSTASDQEVRAHLMKRALTDSVRPEQPLHEQRAQVLQEAGEYLRDAEQRRLAVSSALEILAETQGTDAAMSRLDDEIWHEQKRVAAALTDAHRLGTPEAKRLSLQKKLKHLEAVRNLLAHVIRTS